MPKLKHRVLDPQSLGKTITPWLEGGMPKTCVDVEHCVDFLIMSAPTHKMVITFDPSFSNAPWFVEAFVLHWAQRRRGNQATLRDAMWETVKAMCEMIIRQISGAPLSFGDRVRLALEEGYLTVEQAADRAGCKPAIVYHYCRVERVQAPRSKYLTALRDVLDVPWKWLVDGTGPDPISERAKTALAGRGGKLRRLIRR